VSSDQTPTPVAAEGVPGVRRRGRIIALISGKDGTGKSTVAANLAASLARDFSRSVALLDLDLQTGDQALMFRLPTYPCIEDVLENLDDLTPDTMAESMQRAHALSILTAPPTPERADVFRASHVHTIIKMLASKFDYLVVDVASHLDDVTLEAIDSAHQLVLLTTARLPSIKDTKRLLRVLGDLGKESSRITAVLNETSRVRMSREILESSINFPISLELPYASDALLDAVVDAVPLVLSAPRSEFARAIAQLAQLLTTGDRVPAEAGSGGRWKLPLGRTADAAGKNRSSAVTP
jgi:pilus assembly protein CpaE